MAGEIQIGDVEACKLRASYAITFDAVHGVNWSPDRKLLAFGCADKSVRAISVADGKQVLFTSTHEDRPVDTVFSLDGSHVISVSADRTAKVTELASQRFLDNITSITPGALKGGINSVARHPKADVILVGGADGEPKFYEIFRKSERVIGDDANLVCKLPGLRGRVNGVALSRDGRRAAAVSSLDGAGQLRTYAIDFEFSFPPDILAIQRKRVSERSADEKKKIEEFTAKLFAVAMRPDGELVATAGSDGNVRVIDVKSGEVKHQFVPVTLQTDPAMMTLLADFSQRTQPAYETETLPPGETIESLDVEPKSVRLDQPHDSVQFVVTARTASGDVVDVTRLAERRASNNSVAVSSAGLLVFRKDESNPKRQRGRALQDTPSSRSRETSDGALTSSATNAAQKSESREAPALADASGYMSRREQLARWVTSPDNRYFAKSFVNRMWAYLLGVGLIEPIDDLRAGNPPSNPELLDRLTQEFIASGFNVQQLIKTICKSRTYQLSIAANLIRLKPATEPMLPFVMFPRPLQESNVVGKAGTAGFLGRAFDPYYLYPDGDDMDMSKMDRVRVDDLKLRPDVFAARLERRERFRDALNQGMPDIDKAVASYNLNDYYDRAINLVTSGRARNAFLLDQEPAALRDKYGRHTFGQSLLLARRLIEAGTRVVEVIWPKVANSDNHSWDVHKGLHNRMKNQSCPLLDSGLPAFIEDLDQRGLLSETLVVAIGEFGRSPA